MCLVLMNIVSIYNGVVTILWSLALLIAMAATVRVPIHL